MTARSAPSNALLDAALEYVDRWGWSVFPLLPHSKEPLPGSRGFLDATTDIKQIKAWWRETPDANIGIACNSETGPIIIDIDGPSGRKAIEALGLPLTRTARSGNGKHLYFGPMKDGTRVKRAIRPMGKDVAFDILGDGGYVISPPSIHPDTGHAYRWARRVRPKPLPSAVLALVANKINHGKSAPPLPDVIVEGERDSVLTSLAGSMRRRGASVDAILAAIREENRTRVQPPLIDAQLIKIANSIGQKDPAVRDNGGRSIVVRLSTVKPKPIKWLVRGLLPFGKFSLLEGDPGQGKSTLSLYFAARITKGLPILGEKLEGPRKVVLVTYEDALDDTVRPRIDALGGDPNLIEVFRGVVDGGDDGEERLPEFPNDVERLKAIVEKHRAALVIVDPLGASLSERTDSHNDASVRRVVSRLARLAEDTGASILGVRHLTKGTAANAVRHGGGSIAFIGAARIALLVAEHPDDSDKKQHERRRILATVKSNLKGFLPSQVFALTPVKGHEHAGIKWLGETPLSADDLNAAESAAAPDERSALTECAEWLREYLSAGAKTAVAVYAAGNRAGGWDKAAVWRALKKIGGRTERRGFGEKGAYYWTAAESGADETA
jgi:KaiC/GvpD/RAD55 family RecA-like ATPase